MGTLLTFVTMYKGRESRERPPINYRITKLIPFTTMEK